MYDNLTLKEKAELIRLGVSNGIYSLKDIKNVYNDFANGGSIHIKPENRGKFTALKERTGHSTSWFIKNGTPAQKKMAVFANNARKWKHDEGGDVITGQSVLDRANQVYSNYEDAKDFDLSPLNYKIRKHIGRGLSNCTLTATQWIDPTNPIKSAKSIINDESLGYSQIKPEEAKIGDLMITMNPLRGTFHTMLIEGFDETGQPILRYSNGGHDQSSLRTGITTKEYHERDNKQGGKHTYEMFYRYNRPINVLPEIIVTPNKKDEGGDLYNKDILIQDIVIPKDNTNVFVKEDIPTIPLNNKTYMSDEEYNRILQETENKNYSILNRDQREYFLNQVNSIQESIVEDTLKSLDTKDKIKDVQKELADSGAYDKYIPTSKEDIKKLQRRLVYLGYLKEKINNKNQIDGIVGKNTIKAWRDANVDGILGDKTKAELINKLDSIDVQNADWDIDVKGQRDYCARFVSKKAEISTETDPISTGVYGNAWTMPGNIVNAGGKEIFNIYKSKQFKNIKSGKELYSVTKNYLNRNNIDYSSLKEGDVVGIFMPSSSHHDDVLKTGTTYNTHIGIIVGFDKNNKPIVEHTVGGSVFRDSIDKIKGSMYGKAQVTVAVRPNYKQISEIKLDTNAKSKFNVSEKYQNADMENFILGMAQGENSISKIYPDVPMDIIQQIAIAVQKRETNFMTNKVSDQGKIQQLENDIVEKIKGPETKSTNTSKMKLASLSINERAFLGIKTKDDLEDPKKAGLAAELYLAKNYDYFKRLQKEYPELGITDEDIINATILSYNQGMGKLYTLGFDKEGKANPNQLIELRKLADKDTKIKDVSSTKYRFLGKLGELLYDKLEDPFQPYISSARQAMEENIINTKKYGGKLYSTGGPIYPFSFNKNPLLKTPIVRY